MKHSYNAKNEATSDEIERQRETFVASIGHDLKNPTIAQIRALELFLKEDFGAISSKQREVLEMVLDSCKYMYAMLGTMLITYKYDKGTIFLENEEIDLGNLVQECVDEMTYIAREKNISVTINNTAQKNIFYGDITLIKRVIMNLLSNGIKYAYKNSALCINIYNEGKYVCFSFENSSPYLPPEKCKIIFARYISYARTHNELGVGLGLYASKKIIEAHNGKIFVKSYKNNKNIFGFKLYYDKSFEDKKRYVIF